MHQLVYEFKKKKGETHAKRSPDWLKCYTAIRSCYENAVRFVEILCRQEVGKRLVCKTNNSSARLNTLWRIATRWHFNDSYIFFMELYSHSTHYGSLAALDMKYSYAKAYRVQPEPLCVDSRYSLCELFSIYVCLNRTSYTACCHL